MSQKSTLLRQLGEMVGLYKACLKDTHEIINLDLDASINRLPELLDRRLKMLQRISDLDGVLPVRIEGGRKYLTRVLPADKAEAGRLLEEMSRVLTELVRVDRRMTEKIRQTLRSIGLDLKRLRQGQTALKGYSPFQGRGVPLVDRRS